MTFKYPRRNIPIHTAIIAWQPAFIDSGTDSAPSGQMNVFQRGDLRERHYLCTDGAGWVYWKEQSTEQLIGWLLKLKRELVSEYGIAEWKVEGSLRKIREYREFRVEQRRDRDERKRRKRRPTGQATH